MAIFQPIWPQNPDKILVIFGKYAYIVGMTIHVGACGATASNIGGLNILVICHMFLVDSSLVS